MRALVSDVDVEIDFKFRKVLWKLGLLDKIVDDRPLNFILIGDVCEDK